MKTFSVNVAPDYLQRLTRVKKPLIAIAELIWNGLDADAANVVVTFEANLLGGVEAIRITDDGLGIPPEIAEKSFASLGGSWKQQAGRSRGGRLLHGRAGKGRFMAFSLGSDVSWRTVLRDAKGRLTEYTVSGSIEQLKTFRATEPVPSKASTTGTEVVITGISKEFRSLRGREAVQGIAEQFATYLHQYADIRVEYDGSLIDPAAIERHRQTYDLGNIELPDGKTVHPTLMIVEWKIEAERALYFCDASGFTLERTTVGIQAPGFHFTAYLRDDYLRELDDDGRLSLPDLDPSVAAYVEASRNKLRDHFRGRLAEAASEVVAEWKKQEVYPYHGEPHTNVETAKRQVFDVVALNVHNYSTSFRDADTRGKRLQLRLLQQALEAEPASLQRILAEVLDLPAEKRNELAQLLEQTSLSAIISAAKLVTERLDFLHGLAYMVFEPEIKNVLLERRQLHRILEQHAWLFGEQFHLSLSDKGLTDVLRKHYEKLGTDDGDLGAVYREDGSTGIIDLMLSRAVPYPHHDEHEHLIVELKRPTKDIDLTVVSQLKSYAYAVARDERFRHTKTRWVFWAVSNKLTEDVLIEAQQLNQPAGLISETDNPRVQVWVKSWAQVIEEAKARLGFFRRGLEYEASDESALSLLRRLHGNHLPEQLLPPVTAPTTNLSVVTAVGNDKRAKNGRRKGAR